MDVCLKQNLDLCIFRLSEDVDDRRDGREFAIKKFKPDKEGEAVAHYSGISQSAVREMAVLPFFMMGLMIVMSRSGSY